jgi:hypothetical protein
MKLLKIAFALAFGLLLLSGCIDSFTPSGLKAVEGLLVVDGTITNGRTVFRLSRSVGMDDTLTTAAGIDQAVLYVESNDGRRYEGRAEGEGAYAVEMGDLDANLQYRLTVHLDGEEYQSSYLAPIFSVEIDSIYPLKEGTGEPVLVCLATHDDANRSIYYRWTYRETWEVKAELYANARMGANNTVIFHDLHTSNNTYYCWSRDRSHSLLLASTDKLAANVISRMKLAEIPCDHDKLSILYHIEVEQMQIRQEAFDYFSEMQKNIEHTSDLFSPTLISGANGNIHCLNDPERPVVGYIEVATTTTKDAYIRGDDLFEPPMSKCSSQITPYPHGYAIYLYEEMYAPHGCVDCRLKANASKDRPLNWPTEHY